MTLIEEFVELETAKCAGRPGFIAMVGFFDRVTLDELDLEIHFVKDDTVLTRDSRSFEKFMHGIKILKGRYIYYHCTGFQGEWPEPYTRKEDWP